MNKRGRDSTDDGFQIVESEGDLFEAPDNAVLMRKRASTPPSLDRRGVSVDSFDRRRQLPGPLGRWHREVFQGKCASRPLHFVINVTTFPLGFLVRVKMIGLVRRDGCCEPTTHFCEGPVVSGSFPSLQPALQGARGRRSGWYVSAYSTTAAAAAAGRRGKGFRLGANTRGRRTRPARRQAGKAEEEVIFYLRSGGRSSNKKMEKDALDLLPVHERGLRTDHEAEKGQGCPRRYLAKHANGPRRLQGATGETGTRGRAVAGFARAGGGGCEQPPTPTGGWRA